MNGSVGSVQVEPHAKPLLWVPNSAGLFSHFIQMKIMLAKAKANQRVLTIVPTQSPHYGAKFIDMCTIFTLPSSVQCGTDANATRYCSQNFAELATWDRNSSFCYSGRISFDSSVKGRHAILQAISLPPRLQFGAQYVQSSTRFWFQLTQLVRLRSGLGLPESASWSPRITVVHWRRGDQLSSRCSHLVDVSVNCASAEGLVLKVRSYSGTNAVYVATNEPQDSPHMTNLRQAGFLTYRDVIRFAAATAATADLGTSASASIGTGTGADVDIFGVLAAEVFAMLRADQFLAWGVSEINDLVEYERSASSTTTFGSSSSSSSSSSPSSEKSDSIPVGTSHGNPFMRDPDAQQQATYCIGQDVPQHANQATWCSMHALQQQLAPTSPTSPPPPPQLSLLPTMPPQSPRVSATVTEGDSAAPSTGNDEDKEKEKDKDKNENKEKEKDEDNATRVMQRSGSSTSTSGIPRVRRRK
jgi:hypothetical protein